MIAFEKPGAAKAVVRLVLMAGVLLVSACGSAPTEIPDLICPAVGIVEGTGSVTKFRENGDYYQDDVLYRGHMSGVSVSCDWRGDGVVTTIGVDIAATQGPAGEAEEVGLPYFIAVVRGNKVIAKEVYNSLHNFPGDMRRSHVRERVEQRLALDDRRETARYEILLGFQLKEEEFIYNLSQ